MDPREFGKELTRNPKVNAYALFIASFGDEADQLQRALPLGKAFVVVDTSAMPVVFKQIFQSSSFMTAE